MSGGPVPGTAAARERPPRLDIVETVFQTMLLTLRRALRGRRLVVASLLVVLPLLASVPVGLWAKPRANDGFFYSMLALWHFGLAVPGVALAFATAFPWPEAEEGTLTWWFTAPVPRWAIHLGRFLAAWAVGSLVLPLGVVAIAAPLSPRPEAQILGTVVASITTTLLAYPAYLAIFWLAATVVKRGLVFGVCFVVVENSLSWIPANVAKATLVFYVRAMVFPSIPKSSRFSAERLVRDLEMVGRPTAAMVFAAAAVVALVLALLLVEWIEYRGKESQAT